MMFLYCLIGYFIGILLFLVWEAVIGCGVRFYTDINDGPTAVLAAIFWPVAIPIILLVNFSSLLDSIRNKRIQKEENKTKLRIAAQKELDTYMEQVEAEMKDIVRSAKR